MAQNVRAILDPIRSDGPDGRALVNAFSLRFENLGEASIAVVAGPAVLQLSCSLVTSIRRSERSSPVPLATLGGTISGDASGVSFTGAASAQQDPNLTSTFGQDGHLLPRRTLVVSDPNGQDIPLLLPDEMQVPSGFMEVVTNLTIGGQLHADETQNGTLDVPLLPLSATHAIFHFVDGDGEPLGGLQAQFSVSDGSQLQATTDDFGDLFLDATKNQTYSLIATLPSDDKVAVVETTLSGRDTDVA